MQEPPTVGKCCMIKVAVEIVTHIIVFLVKREIENERGENYTEKMMGCAEVAEEGGDDLYYSDEREVRHAYYVILLCFFICAIFFSYIVCFLLLLFIFWISYQVARFLYEEQPHPVYVVFDFDLKFSLIHFFSYLAFTL